MSLRITTTTLVGLLLVTLLGSAALACSCMILWTPTELRDASDLVVAGRVTAIQPHSNGYDLAVTLQSYEIWKGPTASVFILVTPPDEAACGYPFLVGDEYFVYADDSGDGSYYTHLCGRNRPLAWADEDITELGPPLVVPVTGSGFGMVKARFGPR